MDLWVGFCLIKYLLHILPNSRLAPFSNFGPIFISSKIRYFQTSRNLKTSQVIIMLPIYFCLILYYTLFIPYHMVFSPLWNLCRSGYPNSRGGDWTSDSKERSVLDLFIILFGGQNWLVAKTSKHKSIFHLRRAHGWDSLCSLAAR